MCACVCVWVDICLNCFNFENFPIFRGPIFSPPTYMFIDTEIKHKAMAFLFLLIGKMHLNYWIYHVRLKPNRYESLDFDMNPVSCPYIVPSFKIEMIIITLCQYLFVRYFPGVYVHAVYPHTHSFTLSPYLFFHFSSKHVQ